MAIKKSTKVLHKRIKRWYVESACGAGDTQRLETCDTCKHSKYVTEKVKRVEDWNKVTCKKCLKRKIDPGSEKAKIIHRWIGKTKTRGTWCGAYDNYYQRVRVSFNWEEVSCPKCIKNGEYDGNIL